MRHTGEETVSQFIFSVISTEGRNLWFKKIKYLRFLTFVRNDIFGYCDTVSKAGVQCIFSCLKLLDSGLRRNDEQ